MEFLSTTLLNGLEVIAECNPRAYSTALAFFVKAGARDETDALSGVSHFLEHMVFKGTPRRTADDVNRELDELGSHSNAFTSEEQTAYYITVLPEYSSRAVELLADLMRPALRPEDFEVEKEVILQEIAKYDDQPPFGAHEKAMALHFGTHPLGRNVLGSRESVRALTPDMMRGYFAQRYSPANMTLVGAGAVDFQELVRLAENHCGHWPTATTARETPRAAARTAKRVISHPVAAQQYVVQVANGPAAEDADRYAGRLLATIVGDESGSRFYWDLVDSGRAEFAAMAAHEFQGAGIFMSILCCTPEDTADNVRDMLEIVSEVERSGVRPDELLQAQNKICAYIVLQSERPTNRLFAVGGNWLQRREYLPLRTVLDAYRAVTLDDLAALMVKYPLSQCSTVAVGPLAELAWD